MHQIPQKQFYKEMWDRSSALEPCLEGKPVSMKCNKLDALDISIWHLYNRCRWMIAMIFNCDVVSHQGTNRDRSFFKLKKLNLKTK